ncbi:MAG: hypothetical protein ACR2IV_06575 [Bryobacteraceae bacterium]
MKLGHVFRLASRYANVENAKKFAQHVVPEVVRPVRIIWNQAIGAIFLVLAVYFVGYASVNAHNPPAVIGAAFMGLIMGFFAITSFRRARRVSRL